VHSKIIADAAKRNLAPIGLTRKGRSRVWLDDRGWYVTVVEFQPSGFSKGSYLNVGRSYQHDNDCEKYSSFVGGATSRRSISSLGDS